MGGGDFEPLEIFYSLLKDESYYRFESFIYYMERYRDIKKRFYQPREATLNVVVEDLQSLDDNRQSFYGLSMPSRVGKLLSDDTLVLTTKGWKKHGELSIGDYVFGLDGTPKMVTHVFKKNVANKRVWFTDKTYIDCHENHEWLVYDISKGREVILETKDMADCKKPIKKTGKDRCKYKLPKVCGLKTSNIDLPIMPYTLGVWLGDGTNRHAYITICDTDLAILNSVIEDGYPLRRIDSNKNGCKLYGFVGLRECLQKENMCFTNKTCQKHIPEIYLIASEEQRLDLLAGLIDSDGCLSKDKKRFTYVTTDETLKNDIVKLISTFGWKATMSVQQPKITTSGIHGRKQVYYISFYPTLKIPCRVERKSNNCVSKGRMIGIEKIEDIEPVSGNCISVEGGIYRVGETLKPTHNSTMCLFFLAWVALKRPNSHNALGGHSGILAKGFYKELMNLITTPEYTFKEMYDYFHPEYATKPFPTDKSAEEFTITLGDPDRFATITCRGIDGTWTGAVDVSKDGYLYVDDLVRDREHSLSPIRMENTFQEYLNKMVDRKNDGAKELMVGTLWNVLDPLERIRKQQSGNSGYIFRKIPALDENDESNFAYKINGFSTSYYHDMRNKLDNAEWMAKFMQKPYVREGLLYSPDELQFFNGILPEGDYRIVTAVDVAWGGGDSLSMPICAEYDDGNVYVFAWVHNKGAKEETLPLVTGRIMGNEIRQVRFEGNTGGDLYCQYVSEMLQKAGYKCSCTSKKAPNKMDKISKIIAYSGDVKRKFHFLTPKLPSQEELEKDRELGIKRYIRDKEYQTAMDEMESFVTIGKNEHEDAVDAITQVEMFIENPVSVKTEFLKRFF
jgi:hypothetical protein